MGKHTELEKVTEAMKQAKERRMYERYQAIYLHLIGTSMTAIADILSCFILFWKSRKIGLNLCFCHHTAHS